MPDESIAALGPIAGAGFLAATASQGVWLFLGAFAVLVATLAVLRVVPRTEE
jgi:hypothetical protein